MSNSLPPEILAEIEREALKRYPKRSKNNAFRRTTFILSSEWMYSTHVLPLKEENERLKGRIYELEIGNTLNL